ncbi:MAG: hypothetical protein ACM3N6_11225 [Betaproteobacteria bacterium]
MAAAGLALLALGARAGPALTPTETLWLDLGTPVLRDALREPLPVDIVVQPAAKPGDPPLALGFDAGRCKLVLSMRGNPAAQATLDAIEPDLLGPAVEAMTAHEIGHCWRYVHDQWHRVPAGFVGTGAPPLGDGSARLARLQREMDETRREEGYADLVGLAWTARRNPALYARVHAWLTALRGRKPAAGGHHDTLAWLRAAADPGVFDATKSPFEAALPLWQRGLDVAATPPD